MKIEKNINSLPHNWLIHHIYIKSLKKNLGYISGNVVDIGCGKKPFSKIITSKCRSYIGMEHQKTQHGFSEVDVIGNALSLPFSNSSVDTAISFQVMEHVPEPDIFLKEIHRILRPDGYCLLMTPFMWGEHEIPYDYFRYTRYGIRHLANKAGFKVISIHADNGYLTTATLRFNYFLMRYAKGILKYFIIPLVYYDQYVAYLIEKFINDPGADTANFTTILQKDL
jgi:SAM-dependent methyltransferase